VRLAGYQDLSQISLAILETSGQLSVFPYAAEEPPAAKDLQVNVEEKGIVYDLILEGHIIDTNVSTSGHDLQWLQETIRKNGYARADQIAYLSVDEQDNVFVQGKWRERGVKKS